jgi:uncharacterized protein
VSFRTDQFRIDKSSRTPQGFLRVDGALTRTGIFVYKNSDGTERREYRPPESVFAPAAQASFDNAPITVMHPASRRVTAENAKELSVGHVREPRKDANHLAGSLIVTDAGTIAAVERGELSELSCGYEIDYDATPGTTPEGERYDGVQTNVVGNHVALLPKGQARGGSTCVLRLDSSGDEEMPSVKSLIVMTPEQLVAHTAELAKEKARADAAEALAKAEKVRADQLDGANRVLTTQLADASGTAKFTAAVDARVALLTQARTDAVEVKAGMTEKDIRVAIVCKRLPAFRADGLSDDQVSGAYALAIAMPHPTLAQPVLDTARLDSGEDPIEAARLNGIKAAHKLSEKK